MAGTMGQLSNFSLDRLYQISRGFHKAIRATGKVPPELCTVNTNLNNVIIREKDKL